MGAKMQAITQMLMNNVNQRMTVELINGMNHFIKKEFEKVGALVIEAEAERDELRKQLELAVDSSATEESAGAQEQPEVK